MRLRPPPFSSVLLPFALLVLDDVAAQDAAAVRDGVHACATERRDAARLECYDALARSVGADSTAQRAVQAAEPAPPPVGAAAPAVAALADTGSSRAREPRREDEPETQEVVSTVAALNEIQPGRLEITLANGQVWRQANTERYPLQVGHEVRVYPTRFGNLFRLVSVKLRSFVQVERVR